MLKSKSAPLLLAERARREPQGVAYRAKKLGLYEERTWREYAALVARCALGFRALGLERRGRVPDARRRCRHLRRRGPGVCRQDPADCRPAARPAAYRGDR